MCIQRLTCTSKAGFLLCFRKGDKQLNLSFSCFFPKKKKTDTNNVLWNINMFFKNLFFTVFWWTVFRIFFFRKKKCTSKTYFLPFFREREEQLNHSVWRFCFQRKTWTMYVHRFKTCTSKACFLFCFREREEQLNHSFLRFFQKKKTFKD